MNSELLETVKALPLPDRIELAEALWDSIVQAGYEPALTPAQGEELDRRLEEHRTAPDDVVPWEEIKADADAKHRPRK